MQQHSARWGTGRSCSASCPASQTSPCPSRLSPSSSQSQVTPGGLGANPGSLGVHVTLDLAGQTRFGPDVEAIDAISYDVDPARADAFYAEIRKYWPGLPDGALQPGYAGIRPKLGTPQNPMGDFVIQGPKDHGVSGLVNLFGIESPGLTASLAIARHVGRLI